MWSYEREQARLQEMLEILNDEEGQGVAYDEHSDIDQSDDDEVDHVEEQHDNSDSEQDISDDGEMKLKNDEKRKAMENILQRLSKIINLGIQLGPANLDLTTKDPENIRKTIYRSTL
ncbi:hypothetical protein JTB14_036127 [Gonioctena quinquepunctata]|nr:hypothetical protein JTB14_036127 [Gonioctena quinquepunctata]